MRKIVIELQVDWDGYEDVIDELIVEDAIEARLDGVSWRVLSQSQEDNDSQFDAIQKQEP